MNAQQLLALLDDLARGIAPGPRTPFDLESSCLSLPNVRAGLDRLRGVVRSVLDQSQAKIPDRVLRETHDELVALGYRPTEEQLVRVLRASRSLADPGLKAVSAYGNYRSSMSKRALRQLVAQFASRHTDLFAGPDRGATKLRTKEEPAHLRDPFFRENPFDKLTDDKVEELRREVTALGFRRPTDKLPEFKRKARARYPRAYEPWTRAEQALLIEAMCYTNDAERIAVLFGRTAKSVANAGLKLIHASRQRTDAA